MKRVGVGLVALALAGCTGGGGEVASASRPNYGHLPTGLQGVMGQSARAVAAMLGTPNADVQEGQGRKLQFASRICVLDAYLYPRSGAREPVVTYVDARQRDGAPIDQASCVAALQRRDGGR